MGPPRVFAIAIASLASVASFASFESIAHAQSFPSDDKFVALPCGEAVMTDLYQDQAGAFLERDIVGDILAPAGYRASDVDFLYFRMRIDQDPAPNKAPKSFAWGFEIDLDGNKSTYELMIVADGAGKVVAVRKNTTTTLPNNPADPADDPPVATFPFDKNARTFVAPASKYGDDADFFIDLAVPWSTLVPLGLDKTTPVTVWAATGSTGNTLNGDVACHDGGGGAPQLSTIEPTPTALDPFVDTDGDGFSDAVEIASGTDPKNAASHPSGTPPPLGGNATHPVLEGAGGCAFEPTSDPSGKIGYFAIAAGACFAMIARRTRRRTMQRTIRNGSCPA